MAVEASSANPGLVDRMRRAARLDSSLYDEVDADDSATGQAWTVVALAAVAGAIGAAIGGALASNSAGLVGKVIAALLTSIIGWVVWAFVITWVGTTLMGSTARFSRTLRSLGFAYSPGLLNVFIFVPILGGLIAVVVGIWQLIASFIAVREALQFDNSKTVVVIIIGLVAYLMVAAIVGAFFGVGLLR